MNLSRDFTKRIPSSELESIKGGELAKIIVEALHHEAIPSRMYALVQLILEEAFLVSPFTNNEAIAEIIKRG